MLCHVYSTIKTKEMEGTLICYYNLCRQSPVPDNKTKQRNVSRALEQLNTTPVMGPPTATSALGPVASACFRVEGSSHAGRRREQHTGVSVNPKNARV